MAIVAALCLIGTLLQEGISPVYADSHDLKIKVVYSESANLTYQLDAVSGVLGHLDPADYQALWNAEFLKTEQDRAMVRDWATIKNRYQQSVDLPVDPMPLENAHTGIDLFEAVRIAGLRTESQEAFLDRVALLMTPADTARLGVILEHFTPAFDRWWKREAAQKGKSFVASVQRLLGRDPIRRDLGKFRAFYAPDLPDGSTIAFSLLYRPDRAKAPTSGQQMGSVSVVEFLPNERPEQRLDVVLHELCHYFYMSRSESATRTLQERFIAANDPGAKPAWNLLNEAMATALGNGIIGREFLPSAQWSAYASKPLSFYNNPNIDRAGKRTLRMMDTWLADGRTMDDPAFAKSYVAAMKEEFGEKLTSPAMFLTELFVFVDERFGRPVGSEVRKAFQPASMYMGISDTLTEDDLRSYNSQPGLSAVFVVPPGKLSSLVATRVITAEESAALQAEFDTHQEALLEHSRSLMAHTFVIVAETPEAATRTIKRLKSAPTLFSGLAPYTKVLPEL